MQKFLLVLLIITWSCQSQETANNSISSSEPVISNNLVLRFDVNEELAGSAYRQKATGYLLVIDGDSTLFFPAFTKSKSDGHVNLILGLHPSLSFYEQLNQLNKILPYAAQDYNFDSLSSVYIGRLLQTGDLAIQVTQEYLEHFDGYASTATSEYDTISSFLTTSKLGKQFNGIFEPYGLRVESTSVEKVFYTKLPDAITIDSSLHSSFPDKILDAMVWINLKP